MYGQVHFAKATLNLGGNVVEATDIPAGEKVSILKAWEADERALQRAEDEGMGGGEHAHLQRVQEALGRLQALGAGS